MSESPYDRYSSPLASRNASEEMLRLWSPRYKFNKWRRIWLAVAEAQHEMGLPVTKEQVDELRAVVNRPGGITDAEMKAAEKYERELRHDVMAHVHALGDSCPKAKGIIHLGMTSQDVVCNADLGTMQEAAGLSAAKLYRVVLSLSDAALRTRAIPALAFTHYQPAQPVTVGRRFAQWACELELCHRRIGQWGFSAHAKGFRGATGTQASYLALFGGDGAAVDGFEGMLRRRGFGVADDDIPWLATQTYPRVHDCFILADLASAAAVLHKIATDIRLLCNRKELDEPFEDRQIGSSAMPYKRNPMRCERICGLSRFVM
ncbi:MAG: adenylosuccinate lyase, partial [Phycisphaerales bacterium]|nr:adenylosuccinate lyase [Phycisphaerales bacterium]